MKESKEEVEDAELAAIVAEEESKKSKWVKGAEVQKRDMEMMDVEIVGEATKKEEIFNGKPSISLEVSVKDPEGEARIVSISGRNILRVVNGDGKYPGLGRNRKAWIGQKLRLKAVASDKAKSGYSLQVLPLKLLGSGDGKKGAQAPSLPSEDIEAYF